MNRSMVSVLSLVNDVGRYRKRISEIRNLDRNDGIIIIAIILYSLVFSYLALFKFNSFQLEYDLAVFNQAFWNTTMHGELFTNSLTQSSQFGIHFSPVLFILVPVYALFPGPQTLLIAQSILLGLGAVPVYLCAREILGEKPGCILGLSYLFYPSLHGVNLYDFHEVAFLPLLLGMALWGFLTGRKNLLLLFSLLSLLVKEDVSLIVGMIGIVGLYQNRKKSYPEWWQYLVLIAISVCTLMLFFCIIRPAFAFTSPVMGAGFLPQYLDPFASLSENNENRVMYILMTFIPLLFTPFLAPETLVLSLPSFLEILLSPSPYYYSIMYQYSALIIPVLFFATILALYRIQSGKSGVEKRFFMKVVCLILASTLVCCIVYSPAGSELRLKGTIDEQAMEEHRLYLNQVIETIPKDASVSTQYNLLPLVSDRRYIWLDYSDKADIILIDSAFPKRAREFDDNIPSIQEKFNLVLNENNLYLYVNKANPILTEDLTNSIHKHTGEEDHPDTSSSFPGF